MIFVNDIAGASEKIVPSWMRHFHGKSGMTFVDLVFPAFLFIVGMALPFALTARNAMGEPVWKTAGHVLVRTASLLAVGILMVNGRPDSSMMGWSGTAWQSLMFTSAILAFCSIAPAFKSSPAPEKSRAFRVTSVVLRTLGVASLIFLAFAYRNRRGEPIVSFAPFYVHTSWYGILGLIGWAYLVAAGVFLVSQTNRVALLSSFVLLMCLYPADRGGLFKDFWLARYVGIGGTLGTQAAITVAGVLLASILLTPESKSHAVRIRFALLFIAGCAAAAILVNGLYGINKNSATPSWCLWACAITASLWLVFYLLSDVAHFDRAVQPFALAGQNVLLAYLISEMLPSTRELLGFDGWYSHLSEAGLLHAVARSAGCAMLILAVTVGLNRIGFRLRL